MSHSSDSTLNPSGPNHCTICFGSVHAWKTRSRGAAITRLSTISRSSAQVRRGSALMVVTFCLCRCEESFQTVEARLQGGAGVVEPAGGFGETLDIQPAWTLLPVASARDKAGALQHLQMLRHGRQAHREGYGDLLHGQIAVRRQAAQDSQPGRVAKRGKRLRKGL